MGSEEKYKCNIRYLGIMPYVAVWEAMKRFTCERDNDTQDELWLLEHSPVYTQGQAGKAQHLLQPPLIPVIQSDRGGQITYHGPGQLVAYVLIDLKRRALGIRTLVNQLEEILIHLLMTFDIIAHIKNGAPGVYINEKKIASIGLRVKNGCTYHGVALNVAMDLNPFLLINPCGYTQLQMTQMRDFIDDIDMHLVKKQFAQLFLDFFTH